MKKFIFRVVAMFIAVMLLIGMIQNAYKLYISHDDDEIKKFYTMPSDIQIANIGNSHGLFGFNYEDLEAEYRCMNFSLTAQSLEYDRGIVNQYIDKMDEGSVMIIPISYVSLFMSDYDFDEEYFNTKNKRYYNILDYDNMIRTPFFEYVKRNYLAFFYSGMRYEMAAKFDNYIISASTNNPAGSNSNEIQEVKDANAAENPNIATDAASAYDRHVSDYYIDGKYCFKQELIDSLYEIIEICKEHDVIPIMVTTPYTSAYNDCVQDDFKEAFNGVISQVMEDTGVSYYDYSEDSRFCNNYELFGDSDHLNSDGAIEFTNILFEEHIYEILQAK